MAGTEEKQSRQETTRVIEEVEQFLACHEVALAAGLAELQLIHVPMPAPMDDMVPAILLNLLRQPLAGDAVGQEVRNDLALRIDFLFKQPQQLPPLLART